MHTYKNIVVLDIEFVSSRKWNQPFQVSMFSYRLKGDKLEKISDFDIYINLKPGVHLNRYATKVTGISEAYLRKEGLYYKEATVQSINYLLNFKLEDTLIVGWSPSNDKRMLDILFNGDEQLIDMAAFNFFDLNKSYNKFRGLDLNRGVSLQKACEDFELQDVEFHNSYYDALSTARLLQKFLDEYGTYETIYEIMNRKVKYVKKRNEE